MDVYKDNILDGMVYTFHFQKFSAPAAHSMLNQMTGSETSTLQYVEGLYKRIEDKKFSLKKPHLFDMPDHILEDVVKNLDGESIAIVRKSCRKLRALADNHPRRLEKLNVHFNETKKSVSLHFNGLTVHYIEKEGGCLVELSHRFGATKSIMKRSKFIEGEMKQLATQDLKTILINPKLEIGELEIDKEDGREFYPEFKEFAEMLPTLDHKLHIEHFNWRVHFSSDDLVEIFKSMKPGTLRIIHSEIHRETTNWSHWENKIFNLPQWKEAKTLYCAYLMSWTSCIYLAHFEKVILKTNSHSDRRDEITGEIIMAMKDKLLENKNLNQIIIHDNQGYNPVEKLRDILSPFQSPTDPRWAEFNYPNSNKKLMICVYKNTIWFKGPCFKPHEEKEGMMDVEDDDEEYWSDSEDESEEEVTDEEETSEEESDVEDSDADDN